MRRLSLLLLTITLCHASASAQSQQKTDFMGGNKFAIRVEPFHGTYTSHSYHFEKFRPFSPKGINLGLELPSSQQRPWQQYLGNPTWGIGMSLIDFGHPMVGEAVSMYPYLLIPAVRSKYLGISLKVAGGLGVVTEHWHTGNVDPDNYQYYSPDVNTIFGCYINAYLSAALNVSVPITQNVALNGEAGYIHMSNGRATMPNVGCDMLFAGVGVITTFNAQAKKEPIHFPDLPYKWALNITGSASGHRAWIYYPLYLISSFHAGAVYSVTNWYGVGLGMDVFYNGAIDKGTGRSLYRRDRDYTTMDKVRAGIALNNEFRFGRVTAIADWGVYFYNPSRNYYDHDHPIYGYGPRPLFYKNDGAGTDEAFHYIRFGMKTRVWDNLYVHAACKTHLHIAEYVEFGLGYQIPFLKKGLRNGDSRIFHYKKGWWK